MQDEDSGEEISCPICGSDEDCAHLLAVLDRTFLCCDAGYASSRFGEFGAVVRKVFQPLLAMEQRDALCWDEQDEDVAELWSYALENHEGPEQEPELDGDVLMRLIVDALEAAGGDQYQGTAIEDGSGPGTSSAITLFHADDPPGVFAAALVALKERVEPNIEDEELTAGSSSAPKAARRVAPARKPKPAKKKRAKKKPGTTAHARRSR